MFLAFSSLLLLYYFFSLSSLFMSLVLMPLVLGTAFLMVLFWCRRDQPQGLHFANFPLKLHLATQGSLAETKDMTATQWMQAYSKWIWMMDRNEICICKLQLRRLCMGKYITPYNIIPEKLSEALWMWWLIFLRCACIVCTPYDLTSWQRGA